MLCVLVKMYLFPPLLLSSLNQFYVKIMNMTKLIDVDFHQIGGCTSSWQICILAMLQRCKLIADNNLY